MAGWLSTHVLDTALGVPAEGLEIELWRMDGENWVHIVSKTTNADGRTDKPILDKQDFETGRYMLVFHAGQYLKSTAAAQTDPLFLDEIPIKFGMNDPEAHYHVPLLLSPFGYSTYRGS